jgi:hypothetical protein
MDANFKHILTGDFDTYPTSQNGIWPISQLVLCVVRSTITQWDVEICHFNHATKKWHGQHGDSYDCAHWTHWCELPALPQVAP